MHWHFAEHLVSVLWARPERAFCTCRARATAPLACSPSLSKPSAARSVGPSLNPYPLTSTTAPRHVSGKPEASRHYLSTASALVGAARATPVRQLAPEAVPAHPLAPTAIPSPDTVPCKLHNSGRRHPYPPPQNRPPRAIKGGPRAHPSTQTTSGHPHGTPTISNHRGGAATSQPRSPRPEPLPSVQRHHQTQHDLAEPPRPSASTESHRSAEPQFHPKPSPPRSSSPATPSMSATMAGTHGFASTS